MRRTELSAMLVLGTVAIATAMAIVYAKYLTRAEFVTLQGLTAEHQVLEVQWGRLRLEEAALSTHPRVEELARTNHRMHMPQSGEVRVILTATPLPKGPVRPADDEEGEVRLAQGVAGNAESAKDRLASTAAGEGTHVRR